MGKMSRNKGSSFERRIAKDILKTFPGFDRKDCYRTPLSGGHPFLDSGDLCISPALQKLFPFVVECKHYRDFSLRELLPPSRRFLSWIGQARTSAVRMGRPWLLVVRGNGTPVFVVVGAEKPAVRGLLNALHDGTTTIHNGWWVTLTGPPGRQYLVAPWSQFVEWYNEIRQVR